MTKPTKVKAEVSTHFPNTNPVDVESGDDDLTNAQGAMMLLDPDEVESGSTHCADTPPTFKGDQKAPISAKKAVKADAGSAQPLETPTDVEPGSLSKPNGVDPAAGYLQDNAGMPVIDNAVNAELDDFVEDDLMLASDADDEEFADLGDDQIEAAGDGEFDDLEPLEPAVFEDAISGDDENALQDGGADLDVVADFESLQEGTDDVPIVDIDGTPDEEVDDVVFASVGNALHVLRSNRIIASMGPAAAKRAEVSEVYMRPQFQDVVASTLAKKGLRKGLVQSGFVLAKVKVTAAKATAKVVSAKVEAAVSKRLEAMHARDQVMEQALAIAATGINKQFFKDAQNELKANLESELEAMGVRGASRMIRAMFAQHGVSYAKSILTMAKRIAAMPEQGRESLIAALDMTDGAMEDEVEVEDDNVDDDMEEIPPTVTAALSRPLQANRVPSLLRASNGNSAAFAILAGNKSLV